MVLSILFFCPFFAFFFLRYPCFKYSPLELPACLVDIGVEIVAKAIKAPTAQIANNGGFDGAVVVHKVLEQSDPAVGFDAASGQYVNLVEALESAAGVASLLTTLDCVVTDIPKPDPPAGGMGGMGGMGTLHTHSMPQCV